MVCAKRGSDFIDMKNKIIKHILIKFGILTTNDISMEL